MGGKREIQPCLWQIISPLLLKQGIQVLSIIDRNHVECCPNAEYKTEKELQMPDLPFT